jgi:hypothetical protein
MATMRNTSSGLRCSYSRSRKPALLMVWAPSRAPQANHRLADAQSDDRRTEQQAEVERAVPRPARSSDACSRGHHAAHVTHVRHQGLSPLARAHLIDPSVARHPPSTRSLRCEISLLGSSASSLRLWLRFRVLISGRIRASDSVGVHKMGSRKRGLSPLSTQQTFALFGPVEGESTDSTRFRRLCVGRPHPLGVAGSGGREGHTPPQRASAGRSD